MNDMLLTVEKNESVTWKSLKHQRGGQGLPLLLTPARYGRMDLRRVMAWTSKRGRKFTMDVPMELQIDKTPNSLVTKKQSWYKSHCFHGSSICFLPFSLGFNSKGFAREEGSKNLGSQISPSFQAYKSYQLAPNFPSFLNMIMPSIVLLNIFHLIFIFYAIKRSHFKEILIRKSNKYWLKDYMMENCMKHLIF